MKRFLVPLLIMLTLAAPAQNDGSAAYHTRADSNYISYKKQLEDLYTARGMEKDEIKNLLSEYSRIGLVSNESFARVLAHLYGPGQGIAVLVYFFNNDTLIRILLEPGMVKNVDSFHITREQLADLNIDIVNSINVYAKSEDRSPKKRGGDVTVTGPPGYNFNDAIANASRILFPPGFSRSYRHLMIVPALNIGSIPFHLLRPYGDSDFLIDRCSFSIAPSLLDIVKQRSKQLKARDVNIDEAKLKLDAALFVSNPAYPYSPDYIFPNLPGAKAEVNSVMKYTRSSVVLDSSAATKEKVIAGMNGKDIAYFATHGIASTTDPMQKSFLVLTGTSPFLTAKEVMDLRNDHNFSYPKMVVLSACQTGLGKAMEAGIAGLARSFLIGGSDHVIMSLWNVDDEATAFLMGRFMFYLDKQNFSTPSEPLRNAILDAKAKYKSPALWASFSCFGVDKGPVSPLSVKGIKLKINAENNETKFSLADSIQLVKRLLPLDKVHVTSNEMEADIVVSKGKDFDQLVYPANHEVFSTLSEHTIEESLLSFSKYKYLRDINITDPSVNVEVRLVKLKNGVMNPSRNEGQFSIGDTMVIVIKNHSPFDVYVNILDMQPDGILNAILPGILGYEPETKIPAGKTRYFDEQYLTISYPAGKEVFKVFVSEQPIDLQKLARIYLNLPDFILMEMGVGNRMAAFNILFNIIPK
jgi:hypothetical protein